MNGRLETLKRLAGEVTKTRAIVELGVNRGKSLLALAEGAAAAQVFGVDLWDVKWPEERHGERPTEAWRKSRGFAGQEAFEAFRAALESSEHAGRVTWIKGATQEVAKAWTRPIGLLHIDAAHDEQSVRRDYEDWSTHVVKGGWLCLDDAEPGNKVAQVIEDTILPSGLWADAELIEGRLWIARRQ